MSWKIYDYRSQRGQNLVKDWCVELQKNERTKFTQKIDMLAEVGDSLCPGLAGPIGSSHLYKIKVNGDVAGRLFLCKGPLNMETEYTLLLGAFKKDGRLPFGTIEAAEQRRQDIIRDKDRRCIHERFKI